MFRMMREAKARMQVGPLVDVTKNLLAEVGAHLNAGDWDDPYVYGYFGGATSILLKIGSSGKIDNKSTGVVQAWDGICLRRYLPNFSSRGQAGLLLRKLKTGLTRMKRVRSGRSC